MKVRVSEHQSFLPGSKNLVEGALSTWVRNHMVIGDPDVTQEDFGIPGGQSDEPISELKENLFIKRDKPKLNKDQFSDELQLFQSAIFNNFISRHV